MADINQITLNADGLTFSALDSGQANKSVVFCLHGFPDSPDTYRGQLGPLVAAGHRVIVPTLRGYEPSSQPADGDYSLERLADDVVGWLDHIDVERVHLVGHDWGAAITYTAAAKHPERFRTATALAIPPLPRIPTAVRKVPKQLLLSWYMTFFQLRGLADRALQAKDWALLRRLWNTWSPNHQLSASEWVALRQQFEQPGVVAASLAYYRQNATPPILLGVRSTPAMARHLVSVPTLIVHGTDDGCMDRRLFDHTIDAADYPEGVRRIEVEGAGHFVHLERPDLVNSAILEHLQLGR